VARAPSGDTLAVHGVKPLLKGLAQADRKTKFTVRAIIRRTGDAVQTNAAGRFAKYDAKSAAGYRTIVRQRGVSVEQKYRKTTGLRPNFGALQMRKALVPAAADKAPETKHAMEIALDEIAQRFNRS
jgi:hypothetical protein